MDTDSGLRRSNGLRPPPPRTFQKATPAQEAEAEQGACGRAGAGVTSEAVRRAPGAGLEREIGLRAVSLALCLGAEVEREVL